MEISQAAAAAAANDADENCYQISDDDFDENENGPDENEDTILDECEATHMGRGSYERAWTTEATRALIHIRGPMEDKFNAGRHKRTTLWLYVTKQLQKLGYMYNAAKVQKKWHNILITYNKNIGKKYQSGYVHWEFFEEMFKYLQGKKATYDRASLSIHNQQQDESFEAQYNHKYEEPMPQQQNGMEDLYQNCDSSKRMKYDFESQDELPLEITHENGSTTDADSNNCWWKDYFDRKLDTEREKIQLQREMHRDVMNFNKMSLIQHEKMERIKIDAINNLTATLQKLVEVKNKKC